MSEVENIQTPAGQKSVPSLKTHYAVIRPCLDKPGTRLHYGKPCPYCGKGPVEYDSSLNLVCQGCGKIQSGAFT